MNITPDQSGLIEEIRETAFICRRCNACCTEREPGSNLVLVSPKEVRVIMAGTGLSFDEIAEPYPDTIREGDREYTFAWALKREGGRCMFLGLDTCSIYEVRPWICRTYPFMLDQGKLIISPCNGTGTGDPDDRDQAAVILHDLLSRQKEEDEENERIAKILPTVCIPPGQRVVIDCEGMRIL